MYSLRQELSELAVACIVVGALLVVAAFLAKTSVLYSRVVMVLWWTLALGCLALERVAVRALLRASRARGRNMRSLAIAGAGDLARRVAARVLAADSLGLRPIGYFDDGVPVGTKLPQREGPPALAVKGNLEALVKLAKDGGVDYVYVALPLADEERVMALIHDLSDTTASVFFVPDFFVFEMLQARWTDIDGMPAYSTRMLSNGSCVTPTILNLCLTQSTWRAVTLRVCTPMKWRWAESSPGFAFHAGFSYH